MIKIHQWRHVEAECSPKENYFIDHDNVFIISVHERNRWPKTGFISDCSHKNILNIPVPEHLNDLEMKTILKNLILPYSKTQKFDLTTMLKNSNRKCLAKNTIENAS